MASGARQISRLTEESRVRRSPAAAITSALALIAGLALVFLPGSSAQAAEPTAFWVGSMQSELGCSGDWQPDCAATQLPKDPSGTTYSKTFTLPAGAYEYK